MMNINDKVSYIKRNYRYNLLFNLKNRLHFKLTNYFSYLANKKSSKNLLKGANLYETGNAIGPNFIISPNLSNVTHCASCVPPLTQF